jgi:nitric oxide reductase NorD protein
MLPLTAAELEDRLGESLDPVLSSRRTAIASALAEFDRAQQDFVLHWTGVVAKTNTEMAFQFASHAPEALRGMDLRGVEDWLIHAMDVYDRQGLYPASAVFRDAAGFARAAAERDRGAAFEEIAHVLELFVRGVSGRALKLAAADETWTDTATLHVPARIVRFDSRTDNQALYKAMCAHQWAQTWYGTFRADLASALQGYADPARALRIFHALECMRLDACIARDLPGLARDMQRLRELAGELTGYGPPESWQAAQRRLRQPDATVGTTLQSVRDLYDAEPPDPGCYQGALFPDRVAAVIHARLEHERRELHARLAQLMHDKDKRTPIELARGEPSTPRLRIERDKTESGVRRIEIQLDGQPVVPNADLRALMDSIVQDLGDIPDEYLTAAGDGGYARDNAAKSPEDVWKGTYHEEGAFLYDEWDFRRRHYRKEWCVLRELDVHPAEEPFVAETRRKYTGLIANLRKTFEALRGEDRLLRREPQGENIDLDAVVATRADMRAGMEMSARVHVRRHKLERDIAVMFMVDMSGSTKGWINNAERESLVMLCEALEVLGDRYAIYGFSGMTRKRCELYRVKRFDEPYSDAVRARIAGIQPKDYTRMGVTIRHLTRLLGDIEARTRLLITLSDGKPDDYDGYRGDYGIEDTRQALIEAKRIGVHPFCITIDETARDYLPHMYGAVNWALVSDVKKLPLKVSDIYRRLTM